MTAPQNLPLPRSFGEAIRLEFRRAFHPPFDTPIVVAINAALMSSLWFLLPESMFSRVFELHGALDFAIVLCAWMYADVPATNVLGNDAARMARALDNPAMLRRMLLAKNVMLWLLVSPFCLVVAFFSLVGSNNALAVVFSMTWIAVVPLGMLALSGWMGILFPYHPMPVRYRLAHSRPWFRRLGRWATLIMLPYIVVPMIGIGLMIPTLVVWWLGSSRGLDASIPDNVKGWGIALCCGVALGLSWGGTHLSVWMISKRTEKLRRILSDPTWG